MRLLQQAFDLAPVGGYFAVSTAGGTLLDTARKSTVVGGELTVECDCDVVLALYVLLLFGVGVPCSMCVRVKFCAACRRHVGPVV